MARARTVQVATVAQADQDPEVDPPADDANSDHGDGGDEPEEEPGAVDSSPRQTPKTNDKVDLRNIKCRVFDGAVAPGDFDAKSTDWWLDFQEQVSDAQLNRGPMP